MLPDADAWGAFVAVASKHDLLAIDPSSRYEGVLPWEEYCKARFCRNRMDAGRRMGLSWCKVFYLLLLLQTTPCDYLNLLNGDWVLVEVP